MAEVPEGCDLRGDLGRRAFIFRAIREGRKRRKMLRSFLHAVITRRQFMMNICVIGLLLSVSRKSATPVYNRSCRRLPRNMGWFNLVWSTYSDERFKKTFRISRTTFQFILQRIRHVLDRDTVTEEPISPEFRLAIALYRLSRGDYYYTIAEMTGLGVSTVCTIVNEVTRATVDNLWDECVGQQLPKSEEQFKEKIVDMEEQWQFCCCWAAVDGCHLPIKCPPGNFSCKEYHNFKDFYSIVLMAMVDSNYRFVWGTCGFPGNSHDAVIFQSTKLYSDIKEGTFIPQISKDVNGVQVPPVVLGDSGFPLSSWLMKPYTNAVSTPKQYNFNYGLSRARMVTEGAFGQLKGRWRILLRKCESSTSELKIAALACLVLHNICIDLGDTLPRKLDLTIDPVTNQGRSRAKVRELLQMRECEKIRDTSYQGLLVRDALAEKFWLEKETGIIK